MTYTTKEIIKYAEDTVEFLQYMLNTYKYEDSSPATKKLCKTQLLAFMKQNLEDN